MFRYIVGMMKNAGTFLKYPILQYIPITIRTLGKSENWSNPFNQPSANFFLFQNTQALNSALTRFNINVQLNENNDQLYILALNFQAELVLFRYLTCKIIGYSKVNSYHVFVITKKYFPRRSLHFALYENNGRKLKSINEEIF